MPVPIKVAVSAVFFFAAAFFFDAAFFASFCKGLILALFFFAAGCFFFFPPRSVVGTSVGTAVGMAVGASVGTRVGTVVGTAVDTSDAEQTVVAMASTIPSSADSRAPKPARIVIAGTLSQLVVGGNMFA